MAGDSGGCRARSSAVSTSTSEAVFLQQVAVGAALQRGEQVVVVGVQRGDDLGGRVLRVSSSAEQLHAVAVGQFEVDQDQFERVDAVRARGAAGQRDLAAPFPGRRPR